MDTTKLTALAAQWDEFAADMQRISDNFAPDSPTLASIARGRSRQLEACADELRALIAKETGQ